MTSKRKRQKHKNFGTSLVLGKVQTEQMKGRDKTMLQKNNKYWQEVNSE